MSNQLMNVARFAQTTPAAKAVLMALADLEREGHDNYPCIDELAEYTCYSDRTVISAVQKLEGLGWVTGDHVRGRTTRYKLVPEAIFASYANRTRPLPPFVEQSLMKLLHTKPGQRSEAASPEVVNLAFKLVKPPPKPVQELPSTRSLSPSITHRPIEDTDSTPRPALSEGELAEFALMTNGRRKMKDAALERLKSLTGAAPAQRRAPADQLTADMSEIGPKERSEAD